MQGIWRSSFVARCLRLSANNSGRSVRRKGLQSVQLLIEQFGTPAHARVLDLLQPFLAITRSIDLSAGTGNVPAANGKKEERFDPEQLKTQAA